MKNYFFLIFSSRIWIIVGLQIFFLIFSSQIGGFIFFLIMPNFFWAKLGLWNFFLNHNSKVAEVSVQITHTSYFLFMLFALLSVIPIKLHLCQFPLNYQSNCVRYVSNLKQKIWQILPFHCKRSFKVYTCTTLCRHTN